MFKKATFSLSFFALLSSFFIATAPILAQVSDYEEPEINDDGTSLEEDIIMNGDEVDTSYDIYMDEEEPDTSDALYVEDEDETMNESYIDEEETDMTDIFYMENEDEMDIDEEMYDDALIETAPLRVVTKTVEPFMMSDSFKGFSYDIWEEIAKNLGLEYEWYRVGSTNEMIEEVAAGNADIGIAAVTIKSERMEKVDFSLPFYDSGLQVLVSEKPKAEKFDFMVFVPLLKIIGTLFLFMFVIANIVWFSEHKMDTDFHKNYIQGVWDAFWWSAVTVTTVGYGDKVPRRVLGKLIGIVWMFMGLFIIAYFTSSVTSVITIQQLEGAIHDISDLPGKQVAVVENTAPAMYLESQGLTFKTYSNIEEMIKAVEKQEADAAVYDAPILQYYASTKGVGKVKVVGDVFNPEPYGIVLQKGSPLTRQISQQILDLRESGIYYEIHRKWFGN